MEIEALRRQLSEEITAQFDAKLREAKRQKSQIEEEFETSSEKWRTERRRLNAEIDRLESALADARQSGREIVESRTDLAVDPLEIARLQDAAEEQIKEAAQVWEKERARLQAEISRLQEGIAELIERSNNPLRANPNERGKLESKYDEAIRAKRQAEEALVKAKTEWEAEKLSLLSDTAKLRTYPAQVSASRKVDEQLEKRLQEAVRLQDGLVADLEKARLELSSLKEAHSSELQSMTARLLAAKTDWEAEKLNLVDEATTLRQSADQANAARNVDEQVDKQLQEAVRLRDGLAADLEKSQLEISRLTEAHAAELQNMTARLLAAKTDWEAEKLKLVNEATTLRQSAVQANAARKVDEQVDKQLQEAVRLHDGLASDLKKAELELSRLKEAHSAELQNMTARLHAAKTEWEAEKLNLVNETVKLRTSTAQPSVPRKVDEQVDKRLQEAIRVRDGLASDLEKARHEVLKLKETHSAELQDFTSRYIKTRMDLEKQLRESEEARTKLERELEEAHHKSTQQDGTFSEEMVRLKKELDEAHEEKQRLVFRLADTGDLVSTEVVNDLRHDFEVRMQEIILENSQLSEKVRNATSQLEGDSGRVKAPGGSGHIGAPVSTLNSEAIDEEVHRVKELTSEIAKLIDDPNTELATVIRKNVERAALEAYLKGILFSLGRGKKI